MNNGDMKAKKVVDLDEALFLSGLGWYNIKYCLVLALFLISGVVETLGYSYVLPASKCDLSTTDSQRGIIASMPYIAIIVTSFVWGYLVDTIGRKTALMYSSLAGGMFGILAAFMPELIAFTIFKFLAALCIACPAAAPYTLIGEILPKQHRDIALAITNATQILGSAFVPMLAWAILPTNVTVDFLNYDFRSWRILSFVYSALFLIPVALMSYGPESPKYLIVQGREDEALEVLRTIYAKNTGKSAESYPVKQLELSDETENVKTSLLLSLRNQSIPLLKPPYLKWMALNGFLLFGSFAILNGLFMWVPDILNRVFTRNTVGLTACQIIFQRLNETVVLTKCDDYIGEMTYRINSVANLSCAFVAIFTGAVVKFIGKKVFLVAVFFILACVCLSVNFITENIVFAVLLSSTLLAAVVIGPINAYAIAIFPTNLRGMGIGLGLMFGRLGSFVAVNITGKLINSHCEATFYMFGGLLLLCSLLSLALPKFNMNEETSETNYATKL